MFWENLYGKATYVFVYLSVPNPIFEALVLNYHAI